MAEEKAYTGLQNNYKYIYLSLGSWSVLVFLFATFSYLQLADFTQTIAISQARSHLQKEIVLRSWVALHGGIYVSVSDKTPPNPYLSHLLYRDIQLPDKTPLTLLNPAYLTRLIIAEYKKRYNVDGKITSLTPLNKENKADKWEQNALQSFTRGHNEAATFVTITGRPHLRFMLPLIAERSCLKCHTEQGYQPGDIIGGLTVSLPITNILKGQQSTFKRQILILMFIWLCGIFFILFQGRRIVQRQQENLLITEELRSSKEQLKQSLAERDAITAAVPDVMYMFNEKGKLHWWNKSLEEITNKSMDEIATTHVLDFFIEEDRDKVSLAIAKAHTDGNAVVEGKINTVKGIRLFQLTGVRLTYDNKLYIVGVGHDLSEHRDTEKILLQARNAAESANLAKSAFLSNMSHELRTPLNAILGYTQIFTNDDDLSERHQRGIKIIHESGEHLLMLINDILDLSKIEAGKMNLVPVEFDLPYFLNSVIDVIKVRAAQKNLEFRCDIAEDLPRSIIADELRLRQVLFNLLSNAIKFTETGFCNLIVDAIKCEQNMIILTIQVQDSGPGILPELKEKIFSPFHQSGDPLKFAEGSGLGLAISKKITTLMNGTLEVHSDPGEGSKFSFSIKVPVVKQKVDPGSTALYRQFSVDNKWLHPTPDTSTIEKILQNVQGGDIDAVTKLIVKISTTDDGKFKKFTQEMAAMADDFKLNEMETFLDKIRGKQ